MDVRQALAQRRMVRSFDGTPVPEDLLLSWASDALRSPTAGNTAGVRLVIVRSHRVAEFFDAATDETWRTRARRAAGLQQAGAVVMAFSNPTLYAERYAESDKASSGLGSICLLYTSPSPRD